MYQAKIFCCVSRQRRQWWKNLFDWVYIFGSLCTKCWQFWDVCSILHIVAYCARSCQKKEWIAKRCVYKWQNVTKERETLRRSETHWYWQRTHHRQSSFTHTPCLSIVSVSSTQPSDSPSLPLLHTCSFNWEQRQAADCMLSPSGERQTIERLTTY